MIRIDRIKYRIGSRKTIVEILASHLGIQTKEIKDYEILHKSLDARKKPDLFYMYSVALTLKNPYLEKPAVKRKKAEFYQKKKSYRIPANGEGVLRKPPIVVGSGPAGLFAAYLLAQAGLKPVVLERGDSVEMRTKAVEEFWKTGKLNTESNVSFGEGGAGTFSDGKLNTGVKDKEGRNRYVLDTFVRFGAAKEILYESKPHIGTDVLRDVVRNLREEIIRLGGSFYFKSRFQDFEMKQGRIDSVTILKTDTGLTEKLPCECLILAIGHSARDTYLLLKDRKLPLEPKAFAVGFRMEHSQDFINRCQYGENYKETDSTLPASPYKVTYKSLNGRGVYSFCMCPGGYIVNASSGEGEIAVNGMSYAGRSGVHANSAIVVSVNPSDYIGDDCLSGMYFQKELEAYAYRAGDGKVPVQYLKDYFEAVSNRFGIKAECNGNFSRHPEDEAPSVKGQYSFADLSGILPKDLQVSIVEGITHFDKIMPGFAAPYALLAGVESRTSAPVKILRNEEFECESFEGIYPCGEGCGYAGGIMSAAMDGMKVAEAVIRKYGQIRENHVEY